ncbi:MAG: DUF2461 family protein [Janthinobacterium lividum]
MRRSESCQRTSRGKRLRKLLPDFDNQPLTRVPKGFAADDSAAELLLCRQWALSVRLPGELATSPKLLAEIVTRFRAAAPMVAFLNAALTMKVIRKSMF